MSVYCDISHSTLMLLQSLNKPKEKPPSASFCLRRTRQTVRSKNSGITPALSVVVSAQLAVSYESVMIVSLLDAREMNIC